MEDKLTLIQKEYIALLRYLVNKDVDKNEIIAKEIGIDNSTFSAHKSGRLPKKERIKGIKMNDVVTNLKKRYAVNEDDFQAWKEKIIRLSNSENTLSKNDNIKETSIPNIYIKDELRMFTDFLKKTKESFDCMAFNLEGHLPPERHELIANILKKVKFRILLFDICAIPSLEMAYNELIDGNEIFPEKPYQELISCLARFIEILDNLEDKEKNNLEIRFHPYQSTMRYYCFDKENSQMLIAPYYTKNYRVNAKCLMLSGQAEEVKKYYQDTFEYVWNKATKVDNDNIKDKIAEIEIVKTQYVEYARKKKRIEYLSNTVLVLKPHSFGFNQETSLSNSLQHKPNTETKEEISTKAISEFEQFVKLLESKQIKLLQYHEQQENSKPDAIFPNNWFLTLPGKLFITCPMKEPSRRKERDEKIILDFEQKGFKIIRDLEKYEEENKFLEGTGSLVLDHISKKAYAVISPRTSVEVLSRFCDISGYEAVPFHAIDSKGNPIYHTNVMMSIGLHIVLLGVDTIVEKDRERIKNILAETKKVITISKKQVYDSFLGNGLFVIDQKEQEKFIVSEKAYLSLTDYQKSMIEEQEIEIIHTPIETIERIGGGSARCMMAEIFD